MQKPAMLVGQKGVKYGLHVRQPTHEEKKQAPAGRLAAFSADSDSDEDIGTQVARQAARKVADSKVQEMYAAALAEDPSAFDYDGVYDSIQQQKAAPKLQDKVARQPKYIASLLEQAQLRKREQEITYERQLLKERQKEDHLYDNEEKFITSAYRAKLEEDKKWQESQRLKELEEEQNDVKKLGHMNNFFHSLAKNVALGGTGSSQQVRSKQAAEVENTAGTAAAAGKRQLSPTAGSAADVAAQRRSSSEDESDQQRLQQQRHRSASPAAAVGAEHQQLQQLEQTGIARAEGQQQHAGGAADKQPAQQQAAAAAAVTSAPVPEKHQGRQQQKPAAAEQAAGVGGKRKHDESSVAAARERYLARKRQEKGV